VWNSKRDGRERSAHTTIVARGESLVADRPIAIVEHADQPAAYRYNMSQASTSRSARFVLLARAHLTWAGVVDDPYAHSMLPSSWAPAASFLRLPGLGRLGQNKSFAYLAARTRFYDQFVIEALDRGVEQVVVVAAGYDSRAWRMARQGVTFYEVDLPTTQADKRSRAPEAGPVYVPADVTDPSLADKLTSAGFGSGEATAFTVEGLTMYLAEHQVADLLRTLANLAWPQSRLAVNFGIGFERQGSNSGRIGRSMMALGSERFRFRLSPADAPAFLAKAGWTVDQLLDGQKLSAKYLSGTALAAVNTTTSGFAVEAVRADQESK
jgi:methyltransferase (TIGR00027 family)